MIDWLACVVVKGLGALLCRLPPSVAVWVGTRLGALAYWVQPKRTRIGITNLRAAFDGRLTPAHTRRILRACYRQLGAGVMELLRLPVMDRDYLQRYVTIERYPVLQDALASGRPLLLLTGHYGNWELGSIVAALLGHPIIALARAQRRWPKLYALLVSYRQSKGCTVIHKGSAMRQLIIALTRGHPIGIVGDQASRRGMLIDFFGRPALFAKGPFDLAYDKDAILLPAFIRRRHGPYHHVTFEPPIRLDRAKPKAEAALDGMRQFAALLTRHIQEDPTQWLWMHKRWKHTPARRALILSDGKLGHVKQSLAVLEALRESCPQLTHEIIEVRYRHRAYRLATLLLSWLPGGWSAASWLQRALTPATANALLSRYADVIISCGASMAPVNALWASENRARSIVLMNPAPMPLHRFHLVIAPRHDALPSQPNVVTITGALSPRRREDELQAARMRLKTHPRFRAASSASENGYQAQGCHPILAVFIGGQTPAYDVTPAFVDELMTHVLAACDALQGWCLVTTSRRTSAAVERRLSERLSAAAQCRLLLIASRDAIEGTMEGLLGAADVAVVTGESVSMVSEACASGRPVVIVEPPRQSAGRSGPTKQTRFLQDIMTGGYGCVVPASELDAAIQRAAAASYPKRPLDNFSIVRAAVARFL